MENEPAAKITPNTGIHKRDLKRRLERFLYKKGYSQENLLAASKIRDQDHSREVFAYVSSMYDWASEGVANCDSVSLNNITQWLELMRTADLSNRCEFEAAAVVNSIVMNEIKPLPEKLNGIDLNEAYTFLENALLGHPQKKLTEATKAFISKEIELLIAEANTDESDDVARSMGQSLYHEQEYDYVAQPNKASLDPLFLDERE
ncbi:uncharacterized protein [Drosophila kikkawai]|uniref:Uncharacterized protein n=1 Tax=Drosophila kikkawai TaxID=30033 RepID=A0A6P4IIA3_DROKI|nr:uncharacterized protein LOC108078632 [Drosophila kikkawai]